MRRLVSLSALAPLALCAMLGAGATPARAGMEPANGALRDLGRAPASTRITIGLMLNYHHEADLDSLLDAQGDESSAVYHHFLTQQQFQQYFAPTQGEYARAIASLQRGGFTITHTFENRTLVDAVASAPVVERYFATEIHSVNQAGQGVKFLNVRPPTMPPDIRDIAFDVVGLTDVRTLYPQYKFLPAGAQRAPFSSAHVNSEPLFGPDGGYGPLIFLQSYNFPALNGTTTGTGRATGVATDGDFLDSDLAGYLNYFGVIRTGPATTRVLIDGGPPPGNEAGDSVETALDVETIVSTSPGTALYVYEAKSSSTLVYFTDIYNQAVIDNKIDVMNSSYSECETAFVPSFPKMADKIFKQGAAEGITFNSATGDNGTITYGCNHLSVGTPDDTPHNVAIGGTIMDVNHSTGEETSEVGWNDSSGATGGGVSVVFKTPSWQKKVTNVITTGRNVPDLAFDASPYTGESYYYNGGFEGPIGGTSLASPTFSSELTQYAQLYSTRFGYFNPLLYKGWGKCGYINGATTYFRDITSGSLPPYKAMVGYDQMSGIGAMLQVPTIPDSKKTCQT